MLRDPTCPKEASRDRPEIPDCHSEDDRVHLSGIEPPHMAPEAIALSTELQMHFEQASFYYNDPEMSSGKWSDFS